MVSSIRRSILVAFATTSLLTVAVAQGDPVAAARPNPPAPAVLRAVVPLPVGFETRRVRLTGALRPELRAKLGPVARDVLKRAARPLPPGAVAPTPVDMVKAALADARYFDLTTRSDGDIEALVLLVMMEATNDMDKDLKSIMAETKAMAAAKQCLRTLIDRVKALQCIRDIKPTADMPLAELDKVRAAIGENLDSMNEMSEMTSLRLQMAMDRRSKFISTLSNIMKKTSDTSDAIVQNLK